MKTLKYTLFLILMLARINIIVSQEDVKIEKKAFNIKKDGFKEAWDFIKEGDFSYEEKNKGMYRDALEYYLKAYRYNSNSAELNYKIGVCYIQTIQKTKSISYFEKAYQLNKFVATDVQYLLAQAYQLNFEFNKAIAKYNSYKNSLSPEDLKEKGVEIEKKITECHNGKNITGKSARVLIENIGRSVNSTYPDYSPLITADGSMMFFTSRRDNTTGGERDLSDLQFNEDIYISKFENGKWQNAKNIGKPLNSKDHDATIGLSPDGQKMFVYKQKNGGDIYVSNLEGSEWSSAKSLSRAINSDAHEASASFSPDGQKIYFVSDRKDDNLGMHDIYVSTLGKKGKWEDIKTLGPVINTPYDERSVFMHPDGRTLYFSSQGHNSMGGYDVFRSVMDENGNWTKPENLGYPINTPDDDLFFVLAASGKHGYYSSSIDGGYGDNDIYIIYFLNPELLINSNEDNLLASVLAPVSETVIAEEVEIKMMRLTILKGIITDAFTNDPLEANIEIVDNEKNEIISVFTSNSNTGKYLLSLPSGKNYGIAVKAEGYLFHSENFNIPQATRYQEIEKNISLMNIKKDAKIVLKNIFFETAKSTLLPESYAELGNLVKILNDYPEIHIEISGHTDNTGSRSFNETLSKDRAKEVVDYLVDKEIDKARLEFEGYADDFPIATNDTPEGRQLNRRTEFKILE